MGSYMWDTVFCASRPISYMVQMLRVQQHKALCFRRLLHQQQSQSLLLRDHPKVTKEIPHLFKQQNILPVKWSWMHNDPGKQRCTFVWSIQLSSCGQYRLKKPCCNRHVSSDISCALSVVARSSYTWGTSWWLSGTKANRACRRHACSIQAPRQYKDSWPDSQESVKEQTCWRIALENSNAAEWKVPDAVCNCNCITGLSHMK